MPSARSLRARLRIPEVCEPEKFFIRSAMRLPALETAINKNPVRPDVTSCEFCGHLPVCRPGQECVIAYNPATLSHPRQPTPLPIQRRAVLPPDWIPRLRQRLSLPPIQPIPTWTEFRKPGRSPRGLLLIPDWQR